MKVSFAHMCDYTIVAKDGKVSLIGLFNRVFGESEPTSKIGFYVAVGLELEDADLGREKAVSLRLIGPEAEILTGADAKFAIDPKSDLESGINLVFPFSVQFPKFGPYVFEIRIDEAQPYAVKLLVAKRA